MLNICTDTFPQSCLTYIAFRLSLMETLKLIEFARQFPSESREPYGYLTEVPFLREVAPQVQISLLAETWAKHHSPERHHANLVDESVIYAVCETAAAVVENLPEAVKPYLANGPLKASAHPDHVLASSLRELHLQLANEGDFLLISQLQDLPPDEAAEFKDQFDLPEAYLAPMFEALGRWRVVPQLDLHLTGLLTPREARELLPILGDGVWVNER